MLMLRQLAASASRRSAFARYASSTRGAGVAGFKVMEVLHAANTLEATGVDAQRRRAISLNRIPRRRYSRHVVAAPPRPSCNAERFEASVHDGRREARALRTTQVLHMEVGQPSSPAPP